MPKEALYSQTIVACIWDFDKTLIPSYMQAPLFEAYGIDQETFWKEVNAMPGLYAERGQTVSRDTIYLNHLLSYIKYGDRPLRGLTNHRLRELGEGLLFYPGVVELFRKLKEIPRERREFKRVGISVEHYIVSTGLAEMIRGSAIAPECDGIFGCEFIENPLPPHFLDQEELKIPIEPEISQIGAVVDNTIKTRYIFEINKGSNQDPAIDVNAKMAHSDRRIPIENMIYAADGPSDVPVFSVVKKGGGRCYAVYNPDEPGEFAQNDDLLSRGRVHAYGPADYRQGTQTSRWYEMHVTKICERILEDYETAVRTRVSSPPRHLHKDNDRLPPQPEAGPEQEDLFG